MTRDARRGRMLASVLVFALAAGTALPQDEAGGSPYPTRILCRACAAAETVAAGGAAWRTVLGQRVDALEPWLAHATGGKPVILQTPRASLVAVLDGGSVDPLSSGELYYLRTIFKTLPGAPASLGGHEQAHLLAIRLLKIEHELVDLLDLDASGRVKPAGGIHRPPPSDQVQIFVFSGKAAYDAFVGFRFEQDVWPLAGAILDSGPTSAVLVPSFKDAGARRQFAFTAALQLVRGLSREGAGLQGWLRVGISHHIEEKLSGPPGPKSRTATFPPGMEGPADWGGFIGDLITSGKAGDLGAVASTPENSLTVRSRLQSWSLVTWMIEKDRKAFAAMIRQLFHAPPTETPAKALLEALRPAFQHDLVSLLEAWTADTRRQRSPSDRR